MTLQVGPVLEVDIVGARGENILDVVRRLGLGGATSDSSDADAAHDFATYMAAFMDDSIVDDAVAARDRAEAADVSAAASAVLAGRYDFDTVTSAIAATVPGGYSFLHISGFAGVGDAREILLYKKVVSEPSTHDIYFQSADGAFWEYVPGPNGINVAAAGMLPAVGNNATAWANVQTFIAQLSLSTGGSFCNIFVPNTGIYTFTGSTGIVHDISCGGIAGCGSWFKFTSATSGAKGLRIQATNPGDGNPYRNSRATVRDLALWGANASDSDGLYLDPATPEAVAHVGFEGIQSFGWSRGIWLDMNAYLLTFLRVDSYQNVIGVQDAGSVANSGERITFDSCNFFNNGSSGIKLTNQSGTYKFVACSVDYNCNTVAATVPQIDISGTKATFDSCHVEGRAYPALIVTKNGSTSAYVTCTGTDFIQVEDGGANPFFDFGDGAQVSFHGGTATINNSTDVAMKTRPGSVVTRHGFPLITSAPVVNDTGSTYGNYAGTVV